MDQGTADPNNQNPNNPTNTPGSFGVDPNITPNAPQPSNFEQPVATPAPAPAAETPAAPFPSMTEPIPVSQPPAGEASWANPTTPPVQPTQPEVNPFASVNPSTPQPDPNQNATPANFNPFSAPTAEVPTPTPTAGSEATPTDLSNLASTSEATSYIPSADVSVNPGATTPESPAITPPVAGEQPQAVSAPGGTGGFPKIFIVIGGIILLVVIAASAYFILGIGKSSEQAPTSLPAEQAAPTPPQAIATPALPAATSSASFSNLPGTSVTPTTAPAGSGSAYDLLKKRSVSTSSANP